jgi:DNA-binding NarL/FixJ family response regulator
VLTKAWPAFPADPVYAAAGMTAAGESAAAPIPVRVLADDAFTRDAMLACLRPRSEIRVLASCDAGPARVVLVLSDQVTDETLARMRQAAFPAAGAAGTPSTATAASAESTPYEVGFVLVGDGLRAHHLLGAIAHGPLSVLARRDADTDRVVRAIVGIPEGRLEMPDDAVGWLVTRLRTIHRDVLEPRGLTAAGLGTREVEVLRLLAEGLDTAEIAQAMNYSERTVKSIIHGVLTRCRLRNRAHAVAFALRSGAL